MPQPASADLIAELLLRHYRDPMRYRAQAAREAHALGHLDVVLRLALGSPVEFSDPALRGASVAAELERAAAFYIRQSFFREGASHYEVLGLAPDASADAIRENFRLLMQLVHPDRHGEDSEWPEGFAARANRAHAVLKSPLARADYHRQQAAAHAQETAAARIREAAARAQGAAGRDWGAQGRTGGAAQVPARRRPPPALSPWPEWLTAGVGGFVRRHPAFTVFAGLIAMSASIIGATVWPERDTGLKIGSGYVSPPPAGRVRPERERIAEVSPTGSIAAIDRPSELRAATGEPAAVVAAAPVPVAQPGVPPTIPASAAPAVGVVPRVAVPTIGTATAARFPTAAPLATSAPARDTRSGAPVLRADVRAPPAIVAPVGDGQLHIAEARLPARAIVLPAPAAVPPATVAMPAVVPPVAAPTPAAVPAVPPPPQRAAASSAASPVQPAPANQAASTAVVASAIAAVAVPPARVAGAPSPPPGSADVEALIAAFVSSYESGSLRVFGGLFHDEAQADRQRGRAAIVDEYDQLFRATTSRRMNIAQLRWESVGDRMQAKGELTLKTAWRDGREAEQRVTVDMEIVRQDGHTVISRLGFRPR